MDWTMNDILFSTEDAPDAFKLQLTILSCCHFLFMWNRPLFASIIIANMKGFLFQWRTYFWWFNNYFLHQWALWTTCSCLKTLWNGGFYKWCEVVDDLWPLEMSIFWLEVGLGGMFHAMLGWDTIPGIGIGRDNCGNIGMTLSYGILKPCWT